jgi:hypothetical protein
MVVYFCGDEKWRARIVDGELSSRVDCQLGLGHIDQWCHSHEMTIVRGWVDLPQSS